MRRSSVRLRWVRWLIRWLPLRVRVRVSCGGKECNRAGRTRARRASSHSSAVARGFLRPAARLVTAWLTRWLERAHSVVPFTFKEPCRQPQRRKPSGSCQWPLLLLRGPSSTHADQGEVHGKQRTPGLIRRAHPRSPVHTATRANRRSPHTPRPRAMPRSHHPRRRVDHHLAPHSQIGPLRATEGVCCASKGGQGEERMGDVCGNDPPREGD